LIVLYDRIESEGRGESIKEVAMQDKVFLNHRFVGRMLGEILNESPQVEWVIHDHLSQLSEEDRQWILLSVAIRLAELGKKVQALNIALGLNIGVVELPDIQEALKFALNHGLVVEVDGKIYGYNGANSVIRKLLHELKS